MTDSVKSEILKTLNDQLTKLEAALPQATDEQYVIWTKSSMCVDPVRVCTMGSVNAPHFSAARAFQLASTLRNSGETCKAIPRTEAMSRELESLRETLQQLREM